MVFMMLVTMVCNDVAIVSIKENDCRIHFWYMSKHDAINIMKTFGLNEKTGSI